MSNDRLRSRAFTVTVEGVEEVSPSARRLVLDPGESATAAFRVVPPEIGRQEGTMTVDHGEVTVHEAKIEVLAAENPAMKHPLIRPIRNQLSAAWNTLQELPRPHLGLVIGAAAVILLLFAWFWRKKRKSVMEPQY